MKPDEHTTEMILAGKIRMMFIVGLRCKIAMIAPGRLTIKLEEIKHVSEGQK